MIYLTTVCIGGTVQLKNTASRKVIDFTSFHNIQIIIGVGTGGGGTGGTCPPNFSRSATPTQELAIPVVSSTIFSKSL